ADIAAPQTDVRWCTESRTSQATAGKCARCDEEELVPFTRGCSLFPKGAQLDCVSATWRGLWREHHEIFPSHILASGRECCCVAGRAPHFAGASLSVSAGAQRLRLPRRRGYRHTSAPDGSMAVGSPRPAIHH